MATSDKIQIIKRGNNAYHNKQTRSEKLKEVLHDTLYRCDNDPDLVDVTQALADASRLYMGGFKVSNKTKIKSDMGNISVVEDTTYHYGGSRVKDGKVAVLNFANAKHPGGGVLKGSLAQEECLCRSSNLYRALDTPYLMEHYYYWNRKHMGVRGSDSVIYSKGITVFKDDDIFPNNLPVDQWFQLDVITCAAPRPTPVAPISDEEMLKLHLTRGRNILEVAIDNDVDILVLGAFGCGAFHNPPEIVAEAYRQLLIDAKYAEYFQEVVFAIKKDHNDKKGNYAIFKDAFAYVTPASSIATKSDGDFTFFWHEYETNGFMSQWYKCNFTIEGIKYSSAEQYMMAKKALLFGDTKHYREIMAADDPAECKNIGKLVKPFDPAKWDAVSQEVVYNGNLAKFSQNPELLAALLSTGNTVLAEASPYEKVWGIGLEATNPSAQDKKSWKGKNWLGEVLEKVRRGLGAINC